MGWRLCPSTTRSASRTAAASTARPSRWSASATDRDPADVAGNLTRVEAIDDALPYARTDDGVRIYYETHGSGGRPLVLADGIGGNARHVGRQPRRARRNAPADP